MAINASNESAGRNFTSVPTGTHVMRCYRMIEIGTVTGDFKGKPISQPKVWLDWELPNEQKEFKEGEGLKPFSIGKEFTLSLNEKAKLRMFLEGWRGKAFTEEEAKEFDITKLVGIPCLGSIVEEKKNEKTYSNLTSVSTLIKGMECPKQVNPSFILSYDSFDFDLFNKLPNFLKEKMEKTPEFKKIADKYHEVEFERSKAHVTDEINNPDNDLPF